MNKREDILNDVLDQNNQETERWTKYIDAHNVAITNLETFNKNLEVDVMVPIGPKALMPGKLYHTNEVFVSHYSKMFSQCTAFQATKICQHRIDMAKNQLEKLSTERELFQNKLYVPHSEGVIPNDNEFEIIEKYDEENEKVWRENHKINVRESKRKENETKTLDVSHESVMEILDELELMDELETELNDLGIQDNETLEKLINGQINVTEKKRISHLNNSNSKMIKKVNLSSPNDRLSNVDEISINNVADKNENFLSDNIGETELSEESSDESDDSSTYEVPPEIIAMEEKIKGFSSKEQIQFYKKKLKNIEREIDSMRISNPNELDNKMHKIEIRDYLVDLISILEDEVDDNDKFDMDENVLMQNNKQKKGKRITFALENQIKYIDKTEKVEDMFKKDNIKKRDIIKLDSSFGLNCNENVSIEKSANRFSVINKRDSIAKKVEKNLCFVQEIQSHEDFDLVGKILSAETKISKTLSIKFHHSNNIYQHFSTNNCSHNNKIQIGCPVDFYIMFRDKYPQNLNTNIIYSSTNNDNNNNEEAYADLRTELCSLQKQNTESKHDINSILKKTKECVMDNNNINISNSKITENILLNNFDYDMIVGDVVENQTSESLPEEKFVDSHAPRKRISRFKQSRSMKIV